MIEMIREKIGNSGIKILLFFILFLIFVALLLLGSLFLKKPMKEGASKITLNKNTVEESCERKEQEREKNDCFDKLKMDFAIREENIKKCVEIKSIEIRDDCIKTLAIYDNSRNEKTCLSISNVAKKELCLFRIIITRKDLEMCEVYFKEDLLKKVECKNGVLSSESGGKEIGESLDPLEKRESVLNDTDKDGLLDVDEIFYGTDRFNLDTDGDGISDKQEVDNLTNPLGVGDMDFDGDGINDKDEAKYKTNPSLADSDSDGLSDYDEIFKYKTDPNIKDTDKDGYSDGDEVRNGYNPLGEGKLK